MICTLLPFGVFADEAGDDAAEATSGKCGVNVTWTLTDDGVLTISGKGEMNEYHLFANVPWFLSSAKIKSVVIKDGVASISANAFGGEYLGCSNLKNVVIPTSVKQISNNTFEKCSKLSDVFYAGLSKEWKNVSGSADAFGETVRIHMSVSESEVATHIQDKTVDATCTKEGYETKTCSCKFEYDKTSIDKVPHTYDNNDVCTVCGAAKGCNHYLTKTSEVIEPTCTEQGYTFHSCKVCGYDYKDTYTPALGHKYGSNDKCNRCGELNPDHVHQFKGKEVKPTCTEKGYTEYTCVCGATYKETTTAALGHDYTYKASKAPTKNEVGQLNGTCSRCNNTTTVTLPKLNKTDYTYKETKAATCTATGTATYTWKETKYGTFTFTVTLPTIDHNYSEGKVTQPTCTEKGYTTYTCTVCGDVSKDKYVDALGHNYKNGVCTRCRAKAVDPFVDVKSGSYCYEPILWAYYHDPQITSGVDKTHFAPNVGCTRAEIVTFLWRANGCPVPQAKTKCPFKDIDKDAFYYEAMLWGVEKGIVKGIDETHFAPTVTCTRCQVVTLLWRTDGKPVATSTTCPFVDVNKSAYYYDAMLWAIGNDITEGIDKTHFAPDNTCKRGEIVTFLYRDANTK